MTARVFKALIVVVMLSALLIPIAGQRPFDEFRQRRRAPSSQPSSGASFGEYTFVRTIYDSPSRGYGRRGSCERAST